MGQHPAAAGEALAADGLDVSVVNCRFLKPMDRELLETLVHEHKRFVTIEDGVVTNGFGAAVAAVMQVAAPEVPVIALGVPDHTYEHAPRAQQLAAVRLTPHAIPPPARP